MRQNSRALIPQNMVDDSNHLVCAPKFSFLFYWFQAELAACLERDGFKSIVDAVGADCR